MDDHATSLLKTCPVCGANEFIRITVLWPELIEAWKLSPEEAGYIDLQQGLQCARCKNNLRSMTLAAAMTRAFEVDDTLETLCRANAKVRELSVLEINAAGTLSRFLQFLPKHEQHSFPQLDMQRMTFEDNSIDVIIHSDTLEHVPDSRMALQECRRILKNGGYLFYTVPIVVGRLTRKRQGLTPSYHGQPDTRREDYVVQTEYGADFWCEIFQAGFQDVNLTSLIFPASVAICATKS
jgi:SAM-dependent methyltransferase